MNSEKSLWNCWNFWFSMTKIYLVNSKILILFPAVICNYLENALSFGFLNNISEKIDMKLWIKIGDIDSSNELYKLATSCKNFSMKTLVTLLFLNTKYFFKMWMDNSFMVLMLFSNKFKKFWFNYSLNSSLCYWFASKITTLLSV